MKHRGQLLEQKSEQGIGLFGDLLASVWHVLDVERFPFVTDHLDERSHAVFLKFFLDISLMQHFLEKLNTLGHCDMKSDSD